MQASHAGVARCVGYTEQTVDLLGNVHRSIEAIQSIGANVSTIKDQVSAIVYASRDQATSIALEAST